MVGWAGVCEWGMVYTGRNLQQCLKRGTCVQARSRSRAHVGDWMPRAREDDSEKENAVSTGREDHRAGWEAGEGRYQRWYIRVPLDGW